MFVLNNYNNYNNYNNSYSYSYYIPENQRIGILTINNIFINFKFQNNLKKNSFHTLCRAIKRIGPHNQEIFSIIYGLLLGDGFANRRSGEGVRLNIKQSIIHKEYLF
jgi:hypothetical protein